jgi:2-methylisocitrate lyase-like PEP mutase family enzyme
VLYAPGLTDLADVRRVTSAVKKPVNVLMMMRGVTLAQLADAGVKRVSLGGSLARAAVTALIRASREMLAHGSFEWASDLAPGSELAKLLNR